MEGVSYFQGKVVYICSTAEHSGANIQLLEMLKKMNGWENKPLVMTPPIEEGSLPAAFEKLGLRVERLRMSVINAKLRDPLEFGRFCTGIIKDLVKFTRYFQKANLELVHINAANIMACGIAARICGKACVWQIHEILTPVVVRRIVYFLIALIAHKIVTISVPVAKAFPTWAQKKIKVVHDGVDIERFQPSISGAEIREEFGIPVEAPVIGMVGRFVPRKGHRLFIRSCAMVAKAYPEVHFILVGQKFPAYASYLQEINQLAGSLGLSPKMHFVYWHLDVPKIIAAFNIAVLASTLPEGFGLVLIEAMAMGKPVVATKVGGVIDIVTEDVGYLVPPEDEQAMSTALANLLADEKMAERMGQAGRKRVLKHFTSDQSASRMEQVYRSLLPSKNNSQRPFPRPDKRMI